MRAMILAAGFGTRLQDLTLDLPKPLITIHGHYLIEYALYLLKSAGITEIIINTHYHADKIRTAIQNGGSYGLSISYSHEESILGTGGGLKNAEYFFGDEPFVLINSDIICDVDLRLVIGDHLKNHADATMVVREDRSLPNYNEILLNEDRKILSVSQIPFVQTPKPVIERMFTGIHILSPIVFTYLEPSFSSIISDFYQKAIADGLKIYGYDFSGFWVDAGTKKEVESVNKSRKLPVIHF